ncbi:Ribose-phosphate pyrophosphokinase (RPPK) (5-phospho-D-ribosyl alpha-1-diphosphate) (Phosphoribosyl diphosphate synthase) (Phosphoribosyl pyrophosphate synthase) (P-Rib-PP synthase) (PRPP synthase) (PRPPase), partial [Durusdinium trenchii]
GRHQKGLDFIVHWTPWMKNLMNSIHLTQGMAKMLCSPLAIFSRQRRRATEKSEVDLVGEVQGKTCVVVDDIADTAETLCQAADKLKARGASAVLGVVVHGILSDPACESIMKSQLETVFV